MHENIPTGKYTAIIAGATGLTGSILLDLLLEDVRYRAVIALSRRPLAKTHPKLRVILTDGAHLQEVSQELKGQHVYCCLGTTMKQAGSKAAFEAVDLHYPTLLAKICLEQGAEHFLHISAIGATSHSLVYYSRIKGICEDQLGQLNYPNLSIFRPSILDGARKEHRMGERIALVITRLINPILLGPLRYYRSSKVEVLAEAMRSAAFREETGFRLYSGPFQ
jgi:uncharacterized protein YbjT (DUF2867 family)